MRINISYSIKEPTSLDYSKKIGGDLTFMSKSCPSMRQYTQLTPMVLSGSYSGSINRG